MFIFSPILGTVVSAVVALPSSQQSMIVLCYFVQFYCVGNKIYAYVCVCLYCWCSGQHIDLNTTIVTASTPIVVSINHQESVAAVVGLRMQYRKFYELFMESTKLCDDEKDTACNYTCQSDVSRPPRSFHLYGSMTLHRATLNRGDSATLHRAYE